MGSDVNSFFSLVKAVWQAGDQTRGEFGSAAHLSFPFIFGKSISRSATYTKFRMKGG